VLPNNIDIALKLNYYPVVILKNLDELELAEQIR
jgi:hypothetical protein